MKTYSELITLRTFEERYNYLRLGDILARSAIDDRRYYSQVFYKSHEWRNVIRKRVIIRDKGCDLAIEGREILDPRDCIIHHINPLTAEQFEKRDPLLTDLENLILVSFTTHNAIHYGDESSLILDPIVRCANDTCPWKR